MNLRGEKFSCSTEAFFGAALRQLRLAHGLSQSELGRRLGVSLQQVQKYESGANRMAASTILRAAEILGVEVAALFAGATAAVARSARASKARGKSFLVIPLLLAPRAKARETELIEVARNYQAIKSASERVLVRKLLKRLSADPQGAGKGVAMTDIGEGKACNVR